MKEQNLDFKVVWDFFIEMKYYAIQNYSKKYTYVAFCDFKYSSQ